MSRTHAHTMRITEVSDDLRCEWPEEAGQHDVERERQIDATITMLNEMYDHDGGIGEEFSPL